MAWRRTVNTGAAIYEADRIAAVKAKPETRKSQLRPPCNANVQPFPTCPRCQRTFRAPNGLVGNIRIKCTTRTAPTVAPPSISSSSSTPSTNSGRPPEPPLPSVSSPSLSCCSPSSSSSSSSSTAPAPAVVASAMHINTTHHPDQHYHRRHQWRGPGLHLFSLRPHFRLTRRSGRSLANLSHKDWRTSAWNTHLHPPHPPPLYTLPSHPRKPATRCKVDIGALSETRFTEHGQLKEVGTGYTLFSSGRRKAVRHDVGAVFVIPDDTAGRLPSLPQDTNDHLITLCLPLRGKNSPLLLAPTPSSPNNWSRHATELKVDKLIVLGDFSTHIGLDHAIWEGVLDPHGIGGCNDTASVFFEFVQNTVYSSSSSSSSPMHSSVFRRERTQRGGTSTPGAGSLWITSSPGGETGTTYR
ncbi:hypothetical protein SprV_0100291900 [Sparganum proliferum]